MQVPRAQRRHPPSVQPQNQLQRPLDGSPSHGISIPGKQLALSDETHARACRKVGSTGPTGATVNRSLTKPCDPSRAASIGTTTATPSHTKPNRPHRFLCRPAIRPGNPANRNSNVRARNTKRPRSHFTHSRLANRTMLIQRP
jgi:hypothetical protein